MFLLCILITRKNFDKLLLPADGIRHVLRHECSVSQRRKKRPFLAVTALFEIQELSDILVGKPVYSEVAKGVAMRGDECFA